MKGLRFESTVNCSPFLKRKTASKKEPFFPQNGQCFLEIKRFRNKTPDWFALEKNHYEFSL